MRFDRADRSGQDRRASSFGTIFALYQTLRPERRKRLLLVIGALLISAAAELITIGAVLPFLALIANPDDASRLPGFSLFLSIMGNGSVDDLIEKAAALLVGAAVAAAVMRLLVLRLSQNFVVMVAHDLSTGIFARMLRQPYSLHISRNSSTLLASAEKLQILVSGVLLPLVQGTAAALILAFIAGLLFFISPIVTLAAAISLGFVYALIAALFRKRLRTNSLAIAGAATRRMKIWSETAASMRDILLEGSQNIFEQSFRRFDLRVRAGQSATWFAAAAPRYVVEAAGVVFISLLALYMSRQPGGLAGALPVLGALALGAQRLLPLVQQVYQGATQAMGNIQVVRDILELLHLPVLPTASGRALPRISFDREIRFQGVSFQFESRLGPSIKDIHLTIPKGARVGLIGASGSGKSTFFDLLMGLLEPTAGHISVDGRPLDADSRSGWQRHISHVPQTIFLTDDTIASNIAFAEAEEAIDWDRLREAARRAQIDEFVEELPSGYRTLVGERGVKLSGGQRQRIAIARALYRRASVLILDEATAALDEQTEAAVIRSISEADPGITILIAAHRHSVLACCDRLVRFEAGRIVNVSEG